MHHIGLIGRSRSGKDTAAAYMEWLAQPYTRVAFADPLKAMALRMDPIVNHKTDEVWDIVDGEWELIDSGVTSTRLSEVVANIGWERAKDECPEVRAFLQRLGQSVRDEDEDFWVRIALRKIDSANRWHLPVAVTDVRYLNEVTALQACGFTMVRIERPQTEKPDSHDSENELRDYQTRFTLDNSGSRGSLYRQIDRLLAV